MAWFQYASTSVITIMNGCHSSKSTDVDSFIEVAYSIFDLMIKCTVENVLMNRMIVVCSKVVYTLMHDSIFSLGLWFSGNDGFIIERNEPVLHQSP